MSKSNELRKESLEINPYHAFDVSGITMRKFKVRVKIAVQSHYFGNFSINNIVKSRLYFSNPDLSHNVYDIEKLRLSENV